jgi:hypothetical protein
MTTIFFFLSKSRLGDYLGRRFTKLRSTYLLTCYLPTHGLPTYIWIVHLFRHGYLPTHGLPTYIWIIHIFTHGVSTYPLVGCVLIYTYLPMKYILLTNRPTYIPTYLCRIGTMKILHVIYLRAT